MKNISFVINDEFIEYYVDGKCITDCFSKTDEVAELVQQLHDFANIPLYKNVNYVLAED